LCCLGGIDETKAQNDEWGMDMLYPLLHHPNDGRPPQNGVFKMEIY
jgi:hypothetical protein